MKLKWSRIIADPSFWILLAVNVYLVYQYELNPAIFTTLIWLYWSQSVLYGTFNFLDMLTTGKVDRRSLVDVDAKTSDRTISTGYAWFFLMHYGFFHLVYFIFISTMTKLADFDWQFFYRYLGIFAAFQLFSFIQHKIQNRKQPADIGKMMALPYLRIVPMHLCILIPAFLHVASLTIFLVCKVICDMLSYVVANSFLSREQAMANTATINMDSGL